MKLNKAARKRSVAAAKSRYRDADPRDRAYVEWLQQQRGWSIQQTITYATKGEAGLAALDASPRARTREEIAMARENDKGEQLRRWARIDRICPFRGCVLPIHHCGRHQVVVDIIAKLAAIDDFAARTRDAAPLIHDGGDRPDTDLCRERI